VNPGPDAAEAVADSFHQVLRGLRHRRLGADSPFRPVLLSEVYREAMAQARASKTSSAASGARATRRPADATETAFYSLPERWRAAVWLAEVEQVDRSAVATILGVSGPVAAQLVDRGRQGLLGRFAQADVAAPDHLGAALRPLAATVPASMEGAALKRWKVATTASAGRLAPATDWLSERAARPLGIACGGLVALGMVGLGVLTVASSPASNGPAAAISVPPASGGAPVNPSPGGGHDLILGPGAGASGFASTLGGAAGFGTDALVTPAGGPAGNPILIGEGSAATLPPAAAPAAGTPSPATGATAPSSTGGSSPGAGAAGGGSSGNPGPVPAPAQPLLSVPNVVAVTQPAGGGLAVTAGAPSAPLASASLTPTCTGLQVLNVQLNLCQNPPPPPPPPPAPPLLSGISSLLNNLLK
jgi:hypothetical protein